MDSMNDLDRELARALQVDPAADFAARVRAQIAAAPQPSRWRVPVLALSAIGCAAVVVAANLWLQAPAHPNPWQVSALPNESRAVLVPLVASARSESPQPAANVRTTAAPAIEVMVSRSEMLALQRLFSGVTAAPPPSTPQADELSIPELALDPIPVLTNIEGDRQ